MNGRANVEPMTTRVALHPFLAGMNRKQLALLTDCATAIEYQKGQEIVRTGEVANRFCLLESGKVVLEASSGSGPPVIVDTIGAGDLLGWSWMFPPYTWHFTARAIEPTKAIFFHGTILREYCEKDHSLGYELLKRMTAVMNRRMEATRNKMSAVQLERNAVPPTRLAPSQEKETSLDAVG